MSAELSVPRCPKRKVNKDAITQVDLLYGQYLPEKSEYIVPLVLGLYLSLSRITRCWKAMIKVKCELSVDLI